VALDNRWTTFLPGLLSGPRPLVSVLRAAVRSVTERVSLDPSLLQWIGAGGDASATSHGADSQGHWCDSTAPPYTQSPPRTGPKLVACWEPEAKRVVPPPSTERRSARLTRPVHAVPRRDHQSPRRWPHPHHRRSARRTPRGRAPRRWQTWCLAAARGRPLVDLEQLPNATSCPAQDRRPCPASSSWRVQVTDD
jgi:hypothetical protein